jgi:hypothetical protein
MARQSGRRSNSRAAFAAEITTFLGAKSILSFGKPGHKFSASRQIQDEAPQRGETGSETDQSGPLWRAVIRRKRASRLPSITGLFSLTKQPCPRLKPMRPLVITTRVMKALPLVFTVATATLLFAADEPKITSPAAPGQKPTEPKKPQPPALTLDGKSPQLAPDQKGAAPVPPGALKFTSPEDTGPVITFNEKPALLAPGIYTANPYTGIVVVPGPVVPDFSKNPASTGDVMPQRELELKLTPRNK